MQDKTQSGWTTKLVQRKTMLEEVICFIEKNRKIVDFDSYWETVENQFYILGVYLIMHNCFVI